MTAPTPGSVSREESIEHIAAEATIWVRLAATNHPSEGWQQTMLDMVGGAPPPGWQAHSLRYPLALFEAAEFPGPEVAQWLETSSVTIGGVQIALDTGFSPLNWERRQSSSTYGSYPPLPWPITDVQFSSSAKGQDFGMGELISPDGSVSSFETYYAAAAFVFGLHQGIAGGRGTAPPSYRHQDTAARINRVVVSEISDSVLVEVEGSGLDGSVLELAGSTPGPSTRLRESAVPMTVEFSTANGLPQSPWVLVRRDGQRLDKRTLKRGNQGLEPGVEFVAGVATPLEALIATHENPSVEFKSALPPIEGAKSAVDKEVLRMVKTVAAFANQEGGVVLFGVRNDETIVGIERAHLDGYKQRLTSLVRSWVEPLPEIWYEEFDADDDPNLVVLGLRVRRGEEVPYGAGKREERVVYVRPYSQTLPASISEIRAICQSRMVLADAYSPFGHGGLFKRG